MTFELPELPYAISALEPHISAQTLSYHHGKHHAGYVEKLNAALDGHKLQDCESLEELICNSDGKIYNLAAQVWNHSFYWNCLTPGGGGSPSETTKDKLATAFGSVEKFSDRFKEAALGQFGSGWAWLCRAQDGTLAIDSTTDAINPLSSGLQPVLTLDVWEHAYYLDYKNARADYVDVFLSSLINWSWVDEQLRQ